MKHSLVDETDETHEADETHEVDETYERQGFRSRSGVDGLVGIGLLLIIGIPWIWGFDTAYFVDADALDYAQMGREIRNGHGMATLQIFPRHVSYLKDQGLLDSPTWPNLYRYPITPLLNALFQSTGSDPGKAAVMQSGTWFLISVPIFFLLGRALTNLPVAGVSTVLYAADPMVFRLSYSGLTESVATLLLLTGLLVMWKARATIWKWAILGVLCGLAYLARTQLILLLPFLLLYGLFSQPKGKRIGPVSVICVAFFLTLLPWLGRNFLLTGDPLFSFSTSRNLVLNTGVGPSDLETKLHGPVEMGDVLEQYGQEIRDKFITNVKDYFPSLSYWHQALFLSPPFLLFFLIALGRRESDSAGGYQYFKFGVLGLLVCNFFVTSLTLHSARLYVPFHPLIILIATHTMFDFVSRISKGHSGKVVFFSVLVMLGLGLYQFVGQMSVHGSQEINRQNIKTFEILAEVTDENAVIASDKSQLVAFYAGRRAVRLPGDPEELLEMDESYLPIDYVLLTGQIPMESPGQANNSQMFDTFSAYRSFIKTDVFRRRFLVFRELENGAVLFKKKFSAAGP